DSNLSRLERARQSGDLCIQLSIGPSASRLVFTLPYDGRFLPNRRIPVLVEAIESNVGRSANAPPRPFDAFRNVQRHRVWLDEPNIEKFQKRRPIPAWLRIGAT